MSIPEVANPIELFKAWFEEAQHCGLKEPTSMSLATCDTSGMPSARIVLLKGVNDEGFVFYTNFESQKGRELDANPKAALCFHWMPLARQVRVQGRVERVSDAEADAYFDSRSRDSQIGAWASRQSRPMSNRFELEKEVAAYALKFGIGKIPRPPYWGGYRVRPERIEFWKEGLFRLHERVVYTRSGDAWGTQRVFP
jgi:pyridoxamine 5'-phosphate oxidase